MREHVRRGRWHGVTGVAVVLMAVSACSDDESGAGCFEAGDANLVQPIDATPFGLTLNEWAEKWFEWICQIGPDTNPTIDETGEHCGVGQDDPDVWFLAGTSGGANTRTCDVPEKRAIFFPIITANCVVPDDGETDEAIRTCAGEYMDGVTELEADVDGEPVSNLFGLRAATPAFDVVIADNHPFCSFGKWGERRTAADGYWVMLQPLCNGNHTVHFRGKADGFETEVIYNMTVGAE